MNLTILHKHRIIAIAKTEQGLAWLVEHGPLVAEPPLPTWMLSRLVADKRILRLRRNLFLAPAKDGRLPSLASAINLIAPDGYISGHGALWLHGLNDQDVSHWWSLTQQRRADIRYGPYRVHFTLSPRWAKEGSRTSLSVAGEGVIVATVTQAIVDEVRLMPLGLDWIETARALKNALATEKTSEQEIIRLLGDHPSIATVRRLGLLLETVQSRTNAHLLAIAHQNDDVTRLVGASVTDSTWRVTTPLARDRILRAIR